MLLKYWRNIESYKLILNWKASMSDYDDSLKCELYNFKSIFSVAYAFNWKVETRYNLIYNLLSHVRISEMGKMNDLIWVLHDLKTFHLENFKSNI